MPANDVQIEVAAVSDAGRHRQTNADAFLLDELAGFYGVADGMGDTARSGSVARLALEAVRELFLAPWSQLPPEERSAGEAAERFRLGVMQATGRLYAPRRTAAQRVGTTFAGIAVCGETICVAHVGDSRVGLVRRRDGRLRQLTVDHTVICEALGAHADRQSLETLPNAAALTRVIGRQSSVAPSLDRARWEPGDIVLLCTDGVTDRVEPAAIERILAEATDLAEAAQCIVDHANQLGGRDNSTVVLVRWRGYPDDSSDPGALHPRTARR